MPKEYSFILCAFSRAPVAFAMGEHHLVGFRCRQYQKPHAMYGERGGMERKFTDVLLQIADFKLGSNL